jgi:hypothetical protein
VQQLLHFTGWIESTAFSDWVRGAPTVFAFPTILSCHTVGMGLSAGINAAIAFRILGAAPNVPILEMKRFLPTDDLSFLMELSVEPVAAQLGLVAATA